MPFFKASRKKQDISSLDKAPPENMTSVRSVLTSSVKSVENDLQRIEKSYYGGSPASAIEKLSKWANAVKILMDSSHSTVLTSAGQLDDLLTKASDPSQRFTADSFDVNRVKEVYRKTMDTVPSRFKPLMKDIEAIVAQAVKYCLSFYELDEQAVHHLDTGFNYEVQRQNIQKTITENLGKIVENVQKFKAGHLLASDFSSEVVEIGRKAECLQAPFLLLFPAAVENIHSACKALTAWIEADENYALFISNDMKDLGDRKRDLEKAAQERYERYHHLLFRLKQLQMECERLTEDLKKLSDKDTELTVEEEFLTNLSNEMQLEIEMKEFRRDELIKNASNVHPEILYEKYSELSEDLRDLKQKLPVTKRQLVAVQYKLTWIGEKKGELEVEERKLQQVEKEIQEITQVKEEQEVEHEHVTSVLERACRIHTLKSSPAIVQKIFHGLPVTANHKSRLPGKADKNDPFERVCQLVARTIENDWVRLYRALPFHPYRGASMVDDDIRNFGVMTSRQTPQQVALQALHRWRRYHTLARIEDLKKALRAIHRTDIVLSVNEELNPPRPPTPKEDNFPDFLDENLIPYWKEVEKYDQLRAAKKI